jgi:hypothetical protein
MRIRYNLFASICCLQFAVAMPIMAQDSERVVISDSAASSAKTVSPEESLPAAAVQQKGNSDNSLIQPAFQFFPDFGQGTSTETAVSKTSSLSLTPLNSLLRVQPMKQVGDLASKQDGSLVEAVAPPTLGPPQLPNFAKLSPAAFVFDNTESTVVVAQDVTTSKDDKPIANSDGATEMLSVEKMVGPLDSQEKIFGNLKIDPVSLPAVAADPNDQRLDTLPDGSKAAWQGDVYSWSAPAFYHNPLYFEQVNLERYGQGTYSCLQPAASGAMFFATIPVLPYKIGVQHWNERVHTLGHYRPGNCNPYQIHYSPFSWRGGLYQGAATSGLVFALP